MEAQVKIYVLPGGRVPERQTLGAIGYDVSLRALVSVTEMDPCKPHLRLTLFDFETMPTDPKVARNVFRVGGKLVYRLGPGESVLGGIGFVTAMPHPLFYWVAPRSGLSGKYGITLDNAPGTVDSDYRGEAGVLVHNRSSTSFDLTHHMRIAQIIFQWAVIPRMTVANSVDELEETERGAGGFGSTGW